MRENQEEIWKDIIGYEELYQISNFGRIKNTRFRKYYKFRRNFIMKSGESYDGYMRISLVDEKGKQKTYRLHQLIAQAFIPNPENKRFIHHRNSIRNDNRIENLQWVSSSENTKYAYIDGVLENGNRKKVINIKTKEIFNSIREVANILGISRTNLSMQLNKTRNRINKTNFRFLEEPELNPFKEEINLDDYEILTYNENWNQLRTNKK